MTKISAGNCQGGHLAENCDEKRVAGNLPVRASGGEFKLKDRLAIGKLLASNGQAVVFRSGQTIVKRCQTIG